MIQGYYATSQRVTRLEGLLLPLGKENTCPSWQMSMKVDGMRLEEVL